MSTLRTTVTQLLSHRIVQAALALVGVILVGAVTYYLIGTRAPVLSYATVESGSIAQVISATGTVSPVENPTLSFTAGGRVTGVSATVGEKVSAGQLLASLDTSVLAAELAGAEAKLNELVAGPRAVDVAGQQTALTSAQTSLPDTLVSAEASAESAVATTDSLYTNADTNPQLTALLTSDFDTVTSLDDERRALNTEVGEWRTDAASGNVTVTTTLTHLRSVQSYLNDLSATVGTTKTMSDTEAEELAGYATDVAAARATVNGLILSVTQANTAVESAQDALSQTEAGSPTEDIAVQRATVDGIAAQIAQSEIIAPFAGTVASVSVKEGDVVAPDAPAVSVLPDSALEVEVYVSELEMTKLADGNATDVTLDAYGAGRIFPATVASIDQAPTTDQGQTGYKITLVFTNNDPAIAVGMHANAAIHGGSASEALLIPRSAVIEDGSATYVLKKVGNTTVETPVTLGLVNDTQAEVVSGLAAGDQVAIAGTN